MKKKTVYALLGICLPFCGHAAARTSPTSQGRAQEQEYPERRIASELDAMTAQTVHCSLGARSAAHGGSGFYITADALYWIAQEDGLEYVNKIDIRDNIDTRQKLKTVDFDWHFGYRVGVGYTFDFHDQWDSLLQWTHFNSKAVGSADNSTPLRTAIGNGSTILHPEWGSWGTEFFTPNPTGLPGGVPHGNVPHASAGWHLDFNTIDLDLGRNYFLTKDVSWRPTIGVRMALIHQHYKADYDTAFEKGPGDLTPAVNVVQGTSMNARNNYNGTGLKAGSEILWHLTSHWGITGKCAGSVLYGRNHVIQKYSSFNFSSLFPSHPPESFTLKETTHPIRANIEAALGVQWEMLFCRNKGLFSVALYYEVSEWFAQNQLNRPPFIGANTLVGPTVVQPIAVINKRDPGNLGLQGFNLNVHIDY